jgi:tRNA(Ile2) C34 agmatinyltransferase TiaS
MGIQNTGKIYKRKEVICVVCKKKFIGAGCRKYCESCRTAKNKEYIKEYKRKENYKPDNYIKEIEQSHLHTAEFFKYLTEKIAYE